MVPSSLFKPNIIQKPAEGFTVCSLEINKFPEFLLTVEEMHQMSLAALKAFNIQ
jgi:hypothetical protein